MNTRFYMDEHVSRAITVGLRRQGVDVLTVQEDGRAGITDDELIERATQLNRVLFTQDDDLLMEANNRQKQGVQFSGVVYAHQLKLTIGEAVSDLTLVAEVTESAELMNSVIYLPL